MKRSEIVRLIPLMPAEIIDQIASENAGSKEGARVTVSAHRTDGLHMVATVPITVEDLPSQARRFLGSKAVVVERIRSAPVKDTAREARLDIEVEIPGLPLSISIDSSLVNSMARETSMRAQIEVESHVPLLGGLIEEKALPHVEKMISNSIERLNPKFD